MKYIQEAFDGNWIAPIGPNVDGFEKDLENYLGQESHVAVVSTGTAALHLAMTSGLSSSFRALGSSMQMQSVVSAIKSG